MCRVSVQGPGPGPRYGHVMALVGQRYLMAIGGNDGNWSNASPFALCALFVYLCIYWTLHFVWPLLPRKETFGRCVGLGHSCQALWMAQVGAGRRGSTSMHVYFCLHEFCLFRLIFWHHYVHIGFEFLRTHDSVLNSAFYVLN